MGARLTKRTPGGVAYTGNRTKYPGVAELNMAGSIRVAAQREVMDRLADYEDTGLTPEEIVEMFALIDDTVRKAAHCIAETVPLVAQAVRDALQHMTPEQIVELLQDNLRKN